MVVKAASQPLAREGIAPGMVVADVRAIFPGVEVIPAEPETDARLLNNLAEWCLRYTPVVAADFPATPAAEEPSEKPPSQVTVPSPLSQQEHRGV